MHARVDVLNCAMAVEHIWKKPGTIGVLQGEEAEKLFSCFQCN